MSDQLASTSNGLLLPDHCCRVTYVFSFETPKAAYLIDTSIWSSVILKRVETDLGQRVREYILKAKHRSGDESQAGTKHKPISLKLLNFGFSESTAAALHRFIVCSDFASASN